MPGFYPRLKFWPGVHGSFGITMQIRYVYYIYIINIIIVFSVAIVVGAYNIIYMCILP